MKRYEVAINGYKTFTIDSECDTGKELIKELMVSRWLELPGQTLRIDWTQTATIAVRVIPEVTIPGTENETEAA